MESSGATSVPCDGSRSDSHPGFVYYSSSGVPPSRRSAPSLTLMSETTRRKMQAKLDATLRAKDEAASLADRSRRGWISGTQLSTEEVTQDSLERQRREKTKLRHANSEQVCAPLVARVRPTTCDIVLAVPGHDAFIRLHGDEAFIRPPFASP